MSLKITDEEFRLLLNFLKKLLENHQIDLSSQETIEGEILLESKSNKTSFTVNYRIRPGKTSINFRENDYNTCLIRINLNEGFHKNSNNELIRGNRINLFSESEYYEKNDGKTHMVSYELPYLTFENSSDFETQLISLLDYTNTDYRDKLVIIGTLV